MLRLATAFSGIGAIEFALKRLNKEHEIIFACDNGDVDIDVDIEAENKKIRSLRSFEEKNRYKRP